MNKIKINLDVLFKNKEYELIQKYEKMQNQAKSVIFLGEIKEPNYIFSTVIFDFENKVYEFTRNIRMYDDENIEGYFFELNKALFDSGWEFKKSSLTYENEGASFLVEAENVEKIQQIQK